MRALPLLLLPLLIPAGTPAEDHTWVRGVTISCQTWGGEWGTRGFAGELDELSDLGANWVAIHPYGWIKNTGAVSERPEIDPDEPPEWIAGPIREARRRGMAILIKPHLGYWGSGFSWRGAIDFEAPEERARFFADYRAWIVAVARASRDADAFVVGTELDRLLEHEAEWRAIIAAIREVFDGPLTYAANWSDVERVPFWDALDAIGVQAYFPLSDAESPREADLVAGWKRVLARLRRLHARTGKPVVFTEMGYSSSLFAAREPWRADVTGGPDAARAGELQRLCLATGLNVLTRERAWLRGCFLWKWFVGESRARDFKLDTPEVRAVIAAAWTSD